MNPDNKAFWAVLTLVALAGTSIGWWFSWLARPDKQPVNQIVASNTFPEIQSNVWMIEQGIVMKTNLLKCPHCGQWTIKP